MFSSHIAFNKSTFDQPPYFEVEGDVGKAESSDMGG